LWPTKVCVKVGETGWRLTSVFVLAERPATSFGYAASAVTSRPDIVDAQACGRFGHKLALELSAAADMISNAIAKKEQVRVLLPHSGHPFDFLNFLFLF
jgi:hypothetical protein